MHQQGQGLSALRVRRASIVTTRALGGQSVLHAQALPGKPLTATLGDVIEATERLTRCRLERAYVDQGYQVTKCKIRAASSSPARKRGVLEVIKRELRRRSAIEPVVGQMKTDGHLGAAISRAARAMPRTWS